MKPQAKPSPASKTSHPSARRCLLQRLLWAPRYAIFGVMALLATPSAARAAWVTYTVSGSVGYGYEFHPLHGTQATNLMLTGGVGFVRDYVRLELGVLGAYGAMRTHGPANVKLELRPMLRVTPPLVPIYARLTFVGLSPFDPTRNIAYGGALGVSLPIWRLSAFGEVGVLPRHVEGRMHWIGEARAGVAYRL